MNADDAGHPWFPVWGLRLETPRLVLRPAREPEMDSLCRLAVRGIHDPAEMPFEVPWTDVPSPLRERRTFEFILGCWAGISPEGWRLPFAVCVDGAVVGLQDLAASGWSQRRVVQTGSWLGRDYQGSGLGTEMRSAVLHLAFEALGARRAESIAFEDNAASISVSRRLGYVEDGERFVDRRGVSTRQVCLAIEADRWESSPAAKMPVTLHGVTDDLLEQLGVEGHTGP
ncbi:MAG: GNAT family protein [Microthrixaceae bacterium]